MKTLTPKYDIGDTIICLPSYDTEVHIGTVTGVTVRSEQDPDLANYVQYSAKDETSGRHLSVFESDTFDTEDEAEQQAKIRKIRKAVKTIGYAVMDLQDETDQVVAKVEKIVKSIEEL